MSEDDIECEYARMNMKKIGWFCSWTGSIRRVRCEALETKVVSALLGSAAASANRASA
jgi:hypothetical protein